MTAVPVVHTYPDYGPVVRTGLEAALPDTEFVVLATESDFLDALPDIEALFTFRPPRGRWSEADSLRLVQLAGAGVDSILPAPDLPETVRLCNAVGIHLPEMSEFVVGMLLALHLQVPRLVEQQQRHEWAWVPHAALAGRRAVVVGLGHIGEAVAAQLGAIGLRVDGVRRSGEPVAGVDRVVTPDRLLEVADGADVLVLITPLTDETRGMVDGAVLDALAPGAHVVDVSRGEVMVMDDLVARLRSRHIAGAAVDVFEVEPLPEDSPLWDEPNLLVTPHIAAISPVYMERLVEVFAENVRRLRSGAPALNLVDRDRGY